MTILESLLATRLAQDKEAEEVIKSHNARLPVDKINRKLFTTPGPLGVELQDGIIRQLDIGSGSYGNVIQIEFIDEYTPTQFDNFLKENKELSKSHEILVRDAVNECFHLMKDEKWKCAQGSKFVYCHDGTIVKVTCITESKSKHWCPISWMLECYLYPIVTAYSSKVKQA